jgi:hypothetical protein
MQGFNGPSSLLSYWPHLEEIVLSPLHVVLGPQVSDRCRVISTDEWQRLLESPTMEPNFHLFGNYRAYDTILLKALKKKNIKLVRRCLEM